MAQQQQGPQTSQTPVPIVSSPGIKRDGTVFDDMGYHVDGSWVRWRRGRPQKIPGCQAKANTLKGIPRGIDILSSAGQNYIHCGERNLLEALLVDQNGNPGGVFDRTPVGFVANANNMWQFDQMVNGLGGPAVILAHAAPNLMDLDNSTAGTAYYGTYAATTALVTTGQSFSGGICAIGPFAFGYGSNGQLNWSDSNAPATWSGGLSNQTNVDAQKIVKGMPVRGGVGNAPAGLFWALDALLLATFVGGTPVFNIDFISHSTSILSSQCVIEDLGTYYWIGIDRFYMWNGSLREIPNEMNLDYFFNNLNWPQRNKVFAMRVPHAGEIWWGYPSGTSTECNAYIIYNYRYNTWYDGFWPTSRSSFCYAPTYRYPLVGGTDADAVTTGYKIWQHEYGTDMIDMSGPALAINSFFETGSISPAAQASTTRSVVPINRGIYCESVSPDFVQTGAMTMQITGRSLASAPDNPDTAISFNAASQVGQASLIYPKTTRNIMRFRFTSNVQGGNYQDGVPVAYMDIGDGRRVT